MKPDRISPRHVHFGGFNVDVATQNVSLSLLMLFIPIGSCYFEFALPLSRPRERA